MIVLHKMELTREKRAGTSLPSLLPPHSVSPKGGERGESSNGPKTLAASGCGCGGAVRAIKHALCALPERERETLRLRRRSCCPFQDPTSLCPAAATHTKSNRTPKPKPPPPAAAKPVGLVASAAALLSSAAPARAEDVDAVDSTVATVTELVRVRGDGFLWRAEEEKRRSTMRM